MEQEGLLDECPMCGTDLEEVGFEREGDHVKERMVCPKCEKTYFNYFKGECWMD